MRITVMKMRAVLSLLTVAVLHTCSLTKGYFVIFVIRLVSKLSVPMVIETSDAVILPF